MCSNGGKLKTFQSYDKGFCDEVMMNENFNLTIERFE